MSTDDWAPLAGEAMENYLERVGSRDRYNIHVRRILESHYGVSERQSKELALSSRSYWEKFFTSHIETRRRTGDLTRDSAELFIRKKVNWREEEILEFLDQVGGWKD